MFGSQFAAVRLVASASGVDDATLASAIVSALGAKQLHLILAESLTGGDLSSAIVSVPGASKVLLGCIVAYDSRLKQALLSVSQTTLEEFGAASSKVAAEMARGARSLASQSSATPTSAIVAVSTTGVAGPEAQDGVGVGRVFVAIDGPGLESEGLEFEFEGDRQSIRGQAVRAALEALLTGLTD
jgi:nicotinamide-nucleotide amidase